MGSWAGVPATGVTSPVWLFCEELGCADEDISNEVDIPSMGISAGGATDEDISKAGVPATGVKSPVWPFCEELGRADADILFSFFFLFDTPMARPLPLFRPLLFFVTTAAGIVAGGGPLDDCSASVE